MCHYGPKGEVREDNWGFPSYVFVNHELICCSLLQLVFFKLMVDAAGQLSGCESMPSCPESTLFQLRGNLIGIQRKIWKIEATAGDANHEKIVLKTRSSFEKQHCTALLNIIRQ